MTELEILARAKMYVDKLANGIDPLSNQPTAETDCINQVRVSRCLFYVSGVLQKVIENGGFVGRVRARDLKPFDVSREALENFPFSDVPLTVTEINKRINGLVSDKSTAKLKYRSISAFLTQSGLTKDVLSDAGKRMKIPTEQGLALGLFREEREGKNGKYIATLYNLDAQRFIIDNLEAIIAINNHKED